MLWAVALLTLGWLGLGALTVLVVTAPHPEQISLGPDLGEDKIEDVETVSSDGLTVRGWHLASAGSQRIVLVFSGIGGNRRSNLDVARHYLKRGLSLLLVDLRATGESDGRTVGLGWHERHDVIAWCAWARARGYRKIGLHGQSLGAAAVVYALGEADLSPAFVTLEACYDSIEHALVNRLPWVPLPSVAFLPVHWFGRLRLGASLDELRPLDRLAGLEGPVLFVAGSEDESVLPAETRALFEACGAQSKELLMVEGAGHAQLWAQAPKAYAAALDDLLERSLAPR